MDIITRYKNRVKHIQEIAESFSPEDTGPGYIKGTGFQLLLTELLGMSGKHVELNLQKNGMAFQLTVNSSASLSLFHDLFITEEYGLSKKLDNVSSVIDLGSNIGISAIYFRHLFSDATILCFEPDSSNYELLCTNIKQFENIEASKCAVGAENGDCEFYEYPGKGVSSSFQKRNNKQLKSKIRVKDFDTLVEEHEENEIDLVKFDIEGAEYELFQNTDHLHKVRVYIGEIHPDLTGCSVDEFCNLFDKYDIELTRLNKNRYSFFALRKT